MLAMPLNITHIIPTSYFILPDPLSQCWGTSPTILGHYLEKPRGQSSEWSPQGSPNAKTRGAVGPEGFGRGTFPRDSNHNPTPKAFPYYVILWSPLTSKEGFLSLHPNPTCPQRVSYKVQRLVELNPNILVRLFQRMTHQPPN